MAKKYLYPKITLAFISIAHQHNGIAQWKCEKYKLKKLNKEILMRYKIYNIIHIKKTYESIEPFLKSVTTDT